MEQGRAFLKKKDVNKANNTFVKMFVNKNVHTIYQK